MNKIKVSTKIISLYFIVTLHIFKSLINRQMRKLIEKPHLIFLLAIPILLSDAFCNHRVWILDYAKDESKNLK